MRLTTLSIAISTVILSASLAQAAGHETMTAPDAMTETTVTSATAPATGTYIVLGVLAALLIVAGTADSNDNRPRISVAER